MQSGGGTLRSGIYAAGVWRRRCVDLGPLTGRRHSHTHSRLQVVLYLGRYLVDVLPCGHAARGVGLHGSYGPCGKHSQHLRRKRGRSSLTSVMLVSNSIVYKHATAVVCVCGVEECSFEPEASNVT